MDWIYLDNNATTQPADEVVGAMTQMLESLWANPSSVHRFGQSVRQRVEGARAAVANLLGTRPRSIIFTSGGTESDNLAIRGLLDQTLGDQCGGCLITSSIEHSAVQEPAEAFQAADGQVRCLPTDPDGTVEPRVLLESIKNLELETDKDNCIVLVSIQLANNETGVIQPMAELTRCVQEVRAEAAARGQRRKIFFHTDATQAVGKIPVDVEQLGVDLLTLSAHKIHGPKGIGALFIRSGVRARPQLLGGPQERLLRGGTENSAGIVGFGMAAELATVFLQDKTRIDGLRGLRDRLERGITDAIPDAQIHSKSADRLWNTSNIGFPSLEAEAILLGLSERGVCASAGAACSSGSLEPSPVLRAMGIPDRIAHGSVRFSLSRYTGDQQIDEAIRVVPQVIHRLRRTLPVT